MEQKELLCETRIASPKQEIALRIALGKAQEENVALKEENARLKERLAWLEKAVYGQKSEKTQVVLEGGEQLSLFNEAEQEAEVTPPSVHTTEVRSHKRRKRTRDELMADLPVEEVLRQMRFGDGRHRQGKNP